MRSDDFFAMEEKKRNVCLRLPVKLYVKLNFLSKLSGQSVSDYVGSVLAKAVDDFFRKNGKMSIEEFLEEKDR